MRRYTPVDRARACANNFVVDLASNKPIQTYGLAANPKLQVEGINIADSGSTASASYTTAFPYGEMMIKASGNDVEVSTLAFCSWRS